MGDTPTGTSDAPSAGDVQRTVGDHTVRAFDADLDNLGRMLTSLVELVSHELKDAVEALVRQDAKLARNAIERDLAVDALQREIESSAVLLLARRQPVANDLRYVVAIWETAIELRRVGDLAKGLGKSVLSLDDKYPMPAPVKALRRMARIASKRLQEGVDALVCADIAKARRLWSTDNDIDQMYAAMCRELLTYLMGDGGSQRPAVLLLSCAKNIELIGDHITNIADAVCYAILGHRLGGSGERVPAA